MNRALLAIALLCPAVALATPCTGIVNVRQGDGVPCTGALVGADTVRRINALAECPLALAECRRREAAPLPQECTPIVVRAPSPPVSVTVERTSWTAAIVFGVLGLVGGSAVVLWLGNR